MHRQAEKAQPTISTFTTVSSSMYHIPNNRSQLSESLQRVERFLAARQVADSLPRPDYVSVAASSKSPFFPSNRRAPRTILVLGHGHMGSSRNRIATPGLISDEFKIPGDKFGGLITRLVKGNLIPTGEEQEQLAQLKLTLDDFIHKINVFHGPRGKKDVMACMWLGDTSSFLLNCMTRVELVDIENEVLLEQILELFVHLEDGKEPKPLLPHSANYVSEGVTARSTTAHSIFLKILPRAYQATLPLHWVQADHLRVMACGTKELCLLAGRFEDSSPNQLSLFIKLLEDHSLDLPIRFNKFKIIVATSHGTSSNSETTSVPWQRLVRWANKRNISVHHEVRVLEWFDIEAGFSTLNSEKEANQWPAVYDESAESELTSGSGSNSEEDLRE
ncbi:hypothetical protein T439DRAFT_361107 [Meredithblackwellia eburnea MCA 4105]